MTQQSSTTSHHDRRRVSRATRARHRSAVIALSVFSLMALSCGGDDHDTSDSHQDSGKDSHGTHWSYSGDTGPAVWGSLSEDYIACAAGVEQSPVELSPLEPAALEELVIDYRRSTVTITDNGHTVMAAAINGDAAETSGTLTLEGTGFALLQMHFHAPSEHTINGEFAPAEAHFVHRSDTGELAVFGVMLTEGPDDHPAWAAYTEAVALGEDASLEVTLDWPALLPDDITTIRYSGSLTTPPCTEGVRWMVAHTPVALSAAQLAALNEAYNGNNRPVQDLHSRTLRSDHSHD